MERMRRSLSLALIALGASGPYLDAQRCPENPAARYRPTLRHSDLELAGTYRAPFEFLCGAPATVRVVRTGMELTATVLADAGCPQAGRTRWRGLVPGAAQASFPVRAAGPDGRMVEGTGRIADLCTIEITVNRRTSAYHRTDPECPGTARPLVVFIGGLADGLNRNVVRIYCGYDERWEQTRKLYMSYNEEPARARSLIMERAGAAPVVLVGHSYGGDAAHRLAEALADSADVRLLVTLDPVGSRYQGRQAPRPPGVERWINVRVGSAPGLSSCGLAGAIGGAWGPQPSADADLRFPRDPSRDDPDNDHCKTEQMFLLDEVQSALAAVR
ncbi:MAG TPA: alpha/beta hydrolase [Longimicrobium sp.]|nr:alpha/beta hydrolase [Longimicrobium sp.]